jgi:hypothetical protein
MGTPGYIGTAAQPQICTDSFDYRQRFGWAGFARDLATITLKMLESSRDSLTSSENLPDDIQPRSATSSSQNRDSESSLSTMLKQ